MRAMSAGFRGGEHAADGGQHNYHDDAKADIPRPSLKDVGTRAVVFSERKCFPSVMPMHRDPGGGPARVRQRRAGPNEGDPWECTANVILGSKTRIQGSFDSQSESRLTETQKPKNRGLRLRATFEYGLCSSDGLIGTHVVTPAGGARRQIERDVCG